MLLYNLNLAALTDKGVPLPISDDEKLILCLEDGIFSFQTAGKAEKVEGMPGTFFLTSSRIVLVPEDRKTFMSFFISLERILSTSYSKIEFMCEDNTLGEIYINFSSIFQELLHDQLKQRLSKTVTKGIYDINDEDTPLYFELKNN